MQNKIKIQLFFIFILFNLTNYLYATENTVLNLSVEGNSVKNHLQALSIRLDVNNPIGNSIDLYFAIATPQQELYFVQASSLFSSSYTITSEPLAYASIIPNGEATGVIFSLNSLSSDLPFGYYTFYVLAVKAGEDVFNVDNWQSLLVKTSISIADPTSTLPIPALLTGEANGAGQTEFNLTLQQGEHSFIAATTTATFGINGNYLGPTIRVSDTQKVLFNIKNNLGEDTTIHWHGAHIPAKMDGGPHQIIKSGETWKPNFTIKQNASTLWYHPHLLGKTAAHVIKGLAGFFIVDDAISRQLALPNNYAVDDIPIVIQDRNINSDGTMPYNLTLMRDIMRGYRGDKIVVNGAINPSLNSAAEIIRLRLLNGSNARTYNLGFSDNRTFYQIASDGGLLEKPVSLVRLRLSPGERGEVLLDLRGDLNKTLKLLSYSSEITSTLSLSPNMSDSLDRSDFDIMNFNITRSGSNQLTLPDSLVSIQSIDQSQSNNSRDFVLRAGMGMNSSASFTINNKTMDMARIDETIKLGDTEIWKIYNDSTMAHPFHVHDVQFQIISRNGVAPAANESGWKDTVLVLPDERVEIISRFEDYADTETPYMYHCHILEHEDAGMMGQFLVIP
ncbi:MAG: multicopper oxidase domain-containing protein [Pseudomonadota bacterium]